MQRKAAEERVAPQDTDQSSSLLASFENLWKVKGVTAASESAREAGLQPPASLSAVYCQCLGVGVSAGTDGHGPIPRKRLLAEFG